jgi:integrase
MGAKMNLNLDKPNGQQQTIVFHSVHYKGQRFRITTGDLIEPKHWDKDNQQIKRTRANFNAYNSKFREQQNEIEKVVINLERAGRKVTKETVCSQLQWITVPETSGSDIISVYKAFIAKHCANKENATRKHYETSIAKLEGYQKKIGKTLTFFDFDKEFYASFMGYLLTDAGLFDNSAGNHIKHLKAFLKWANDEGFTDNTIYAKWKVTNEDGKDVFFLKYPEIKIIEALNLEPRLEKVKDLFLIACYTGLRYGDINSLKSTDSNEGVITKSTEKTGEKVDIPIIPELDTILKKYWGQKIPLPKISNQKGNKYIKEIVEKAGIDRPFTYIQKRNKKAVGQDKPFEAWEMCSWHTARHSFITNCIQLKISPEVVRRIVGHKSFKTMSRYIQYDLDFSKNEMKKYSLKL